MEDNKTSDLPEETPANTTETSHPNETQKAFPEEEVRATKDFPADKSPEQNEDAADKFAQKQAQYKQILEQNAVLTEESRYIWRIGFGRRLGAYLLDNLFVWVLIVVAATLTGLADELVGYFSDTNSFTSPEKLTQLTNFINAQLLPLSLAVMFVYYSLEVIFAQSLGKMLLGIMIGDADKKFARFPKLLLRCCLKNISTIISLLLLVTSLNFLDTLSSICGFIITIGCFFVLRETRQALHDNMAGTAVYFKDELQQMNAKTNGQII